MNLFKLKLILLAFCLAAVAGSHLYIHALDEGMVASDNEAFDSYVHFAQAMKREHKAHATHEDTQTSVWAALDSPTKKHR